MELIEESQCGAEYRCGSGAAGRGVASGLLLRCAKESSAGEQGFDRQNEVAGRVSLADIPARAGTPGIAGQLAGLVHSENQDLAGRAYFGDSRGSFQTTHSGHGDVEQNDGGL